MLIIGQTMPGKQEATVFVLRDKVYLTGLSRNQNPIQMVFEREEIATLDIDDLGLSHWVNFVFYITTPYGDIDIDAEDIFVACAPPAENAIYRAIEKLECLNPEGFDGCMRLEYTDRWRLACEGHSVKVDF